MFILSATGPWTPDQAVSRVRDLARDMGLCFTLTGVLASYCGNLANCEGGGWAGVWGSNHLINYSTVNDVLSILVSFFSVGFL